MKIKSFYAEHNLLEEHKSLKNDISTIRTYLIASPFLLFFLYSYTDVLNLFFGTFVTGLLGYYYYWVSQMSHGLLDGVPSQKVVLSGKSVLGVLSLWLVLNTFVVYIMGRNATYDIGGAYTLLLVQAIALFVCWRFIKHTSSLLDNKTNGVKSESKV
jgi:hypothetical protein